MKIKSFGCSFIFGSELHDNPESSVLVNPTGQFSRLTWPALLAQKLNFEYDCHARPGSGNLQITERILNACANLDSDFFIICWTYIDRFDYIESLDPWQPWSTITPTSDSREAKLYYQYLNSEYQDKLSTLICIKTVIDTLLQKNIKFLMTYMDNLMFDQNWHSTPSIRNLQGYIKPYMTTFNNQTFLDFSRANGYPISNKLHPLELAHCAAADYILTVFDKQITSACL
jgi:hypothetical protein